MPSTPKPIPTTTTATTEARTIEELLKENEYLRTEVAYLKKVGRIGASPPTSRPEKAQVVNELRSQYDLAVALDIAQLSRSTYYYHLKATRAADKYAALKTRIRQVYAHHKGRYGYRRITDVLRRTGELVNHKTVRRLMQCLGLKSKVRPKKYRSYRGEMGCIAPNLLQRTFDADRPHQKWVTDVTEFKVKGEKLYLSPVMDLFNGEIVAYQIEQRPVLGLVTRMLEKALAKLAPSQKPLLHSDQGWQYQHVRYRQRLAEQQLTQSMSRKGNCLDNAAMESFFATLKTEFFYLNTFNSIAQLREGIHRYIHYYNHERIKSKLKGLSPVEYRTQAMAA